ncbi:hypothetical protein KAU43_04205 [candidate division WOR-3 bacterium]|nr:hypothetical protein [candidate division WOR-3 bacterium]
MSINFDKLNKKVRTVRFYSLVDELKHLFDCGTRTCPRHNTAYKRNCGMNGLRASGRR